MYPIYFVFSVQILNSNLFSCNMVYFKHHFCLFSYAFLSGFTKRYCFIFFDLMNFTVLILARSSCALTNYLLFYSRPSWWKSWQCFSSWEYGMTLTLILSLWLINFLWILCEFYLILSLFQAPGSETVVQSFGKKWCEKCVGLGKERTAAAPLLKSRTSYFRLLYFRDFLRNLAQAIS